MAEELAAGIDPSWPFTRELPKFGKTPQGKIVCSVARRLSGREIGDLLAKLERSWEPLIAALPATDVEVAA